MLTVFDLCLLHKVVTIYGAVCTEFLQIVQIIVIIFNYFMQFVLCCSFV